MSGEFIDVGLYVVLCTYTHIYINFKFKFSLTSSYNVLSDINMIGPYMYKR